ncbi:MAG: hypothetical protein IJ251_06155 [Oscillospiraceae bacterium]|nr:hypothetical protein [Oscillospiraceae bacterium]
MSLKDSIKGFLKLSGTYAKAAEYLTSKGYNREYIDLLDELTASAKKRDIPEGMALKAQGLLYMGELTEAAEVFAVTDIRHLPKEIASICVNNYIFCLFLLDRFRESADIYREYNDIALDGSSFMKRSVGIMEHIGERYENAVTVFVKLISEPDPRNTLMADICLARSMLRLDMNDRVRELAKGFDKYHGKAQITSLTEKMKMKATSHAAPDKRKKKRG